MNLISWQKNGNSEAVMSTNFHESYGSGITKPPSERSTGFVFAAIAVVVAILNRRSPVVPWVALVVSLVLVVVSLGTPSLLKPLNIFWFRLGLLLHRIVNPLVMFILFAAVFVPGGMVMRLWHDPLQVRRRAGTYWIERESGDRSKGSMINQF
jgi:hypothetical protein